MSIWYLLIKGEKMNQIVRIDTNTLNALNKAFLGFDSLFTDFEQRFANQINNNYPPYNILKHGKDTYEIQVAVTGFSSEEITVEVDQQQLVIKGEKPEDDADTETQYIHRGLAQRNFTRVLPLAEHIEVGDAAIKNGVLSVTLTRVIPEALKPRVLKIKAL
jgi:molecular chaperone IbpA